MVAATRAQVYPNRPRPKRILAPRCHFIVTTTEPSAVWGLRPAARRVRG